MLAAQADLTIEGPDVAVHVHGDGPILFADVSGGFRLVVRAVASLLRAIGFVRKLSRSLHTVGLRMEVRFKGWTVMRLG